MLLVEILCDAKGKSPLRLSLGRLAPAGGRKESGVS